MPEATTQLWSFAQQINRLREEKLPVRVGVILPTFNRPDLARSAVLQFAVQSRAPDIICVHQNGVSDSYFWAVEDIRLAPRVAWLHTASALPQSRWYSIPLKYLLEEGCTHFFWADHDDIYQREHVEKGLLDLKDFDFSVSPKCGILFTRPSDYRYDPEVDFKSHAPGGMSSTMCFTRSFARELLADIEAQPLDTLTDNIIASVTMPKFRCTISSRATSVYHSHEGSITSRDWLPGAFRDEAKGTE
jgi:hypothetical protein